MPLLYRISIIIVILASTPVNGELHVETILPLTALDTEGDKSGFACPFDYQAGQIFTVHVESRNANGKNDVNLNTVVRKGTKQSDGQWKWEEKVIEQRTIFDPWHTQASIAVDKDGYVHVAYNMHNMPWQYSVSKNPYDISYFEFRGQAISMAEIEAVKFRNETNFPQIGFASIPGNQITYPAFFKDREGELYITYRYSLKPAQSWSNRDFAGGLAKYNVKDKTWTSIGGQTSITSFDAKLDVGNSTTTQHPLIFNRGYSVYLITLGFDSKNGMHVFWHWRAGGAGMNTTHPSYAYSPDGRNFFRSSGQLYALPINLESSELAGGFTAREQFFTPKFVGVFNDDSPYVIMQPISGGRLLTHFDKNKNHWSKPEEMPYGAPVLLIDNEGNQWAFASGLRVFKKTRKIRKWVEYGKISNGLCEPKVKFIDGENIFVIHAKSCDAKFATIFSLHIK